LTMWRPCDDCVPILRRGSVGICDRRASVPREVALNWRAADRASGGMLPADRGTMTPRLVAPAGGQVG